MKIFRLIALTFLLAGGLASADTVRVPGVAADDGSRPTRGMTQTRVESKFGAPNSRRAAVGDPPISRWEYDGFVVYFEYDKVIHSVVKR